MFPVWWANFYFHVFVWWGNFYSLVYDWEKEGKDQLCRDEKRQSHYLETEMSMSEGKQKTDKQKYYKLKRECKPLAASGSVRYLRSSWPLCHILKLEINEYGRRNVDRVFFHFVFGRFMECMKSLWVETVHWNRRKLSLGAFKAATPGKYDWLKL